ncbi:ER membrane glycoprotein subunit of the GPI transamidase complex-like protein [Cryptotrichosporon argae]
MLHAPSSPVRLLVVLSLAHSLLTLALIHLVSLFVPAFDASHARPTVRWDAVHFLGIARAGYGFEQQLAFQPGFFALVRAPWVFVEHARRLLSWAVGAGGHVGRHTALGDLAEGQLVLSATIINVLARTAATVQLYRLTKRVSAPPFALTAALLYILAPCPAVLVSPYTEPTYALCVMTGYGLALDGRVWAAALALGAGTSVRSTGVFNAAVLAWLAVFACGRPSLRTAVERAAAAAGPCLVVVAPFVLFQTYAYASFCRPSTRPWCAARVPVAYSFVQREYWNVGWLHYWTLSQLPNFLIAAPVLALSALGVLRYFRARPGTPARAHPVSRAAAPLVLHHAAMTALVLTTSHVQIALRVCAADPTVWWSAAALAFDWSAPPAGGGEPEAEHTGGSADERKGQVRQASRQMTRIGKAWVAWAVVWGASSVVLWAGHYPPA